MVTRLNQVMVEERLYKNFSHTLQYSMLYTILYYTILYYSILHYSVLYYTRLYYTMT